MDLDIYTTEMSKSVWDKAFFMDKIPGTKLVIDFGCADGAMIRMLSKLFPNITFYGYDINDELIDEAWHKLDGQSWMNTFFFRSHKTMADTRDSFEDMIELAKYFYKPEEICINFSSVLHEVFSSSPSGQEAIKKLVNELNPKYLTIRDMYFDYTQNIIDRSLYLEIVNKLDIDLKAVLEFEEKFGPIAMWKNFIHFLMKYQWRNNGWDQEMEEDYFSWNIHDFTELVNDYSVIFETHYQLPYYIENWRHLFFKPDLHTHAQFILRRNENA